MANIISAIVIFIIVGTASFYIWKHRKKGVKCIGCPYANSCTSVCSGKSSALEKLSAAHK